jgi:hypothetical protein
MEGVTWTIEGWGDWPLRYEDPGRAPAGGCVRTPLPYICSEVHLEALKDRLGNVGFVTRNVTRVGGGEGNEEPRDTEVSTGEDLPEWARRDSNARPLAPEASALSN